MRRISFNKLLLIGSFAVVTMTAACGNSLSQNTSDHGLYWEQIASSTTTPPAASHLVPDPVWYNRCAQRVELYMEYQVFPILSYSGKFDRNTLWSWNGSKWQSQVVDLSLGMGGRHMTWNSDNCTAVLPQMLNPGNDYPAKSYPGQVINPTLSWNGKSWRIVSVTSPGLGLGNVIVYDPATHTVVLSGSNLVWYNGERTWPVPTGDTVQVIHDMEHMWQEARISKTIPFFQISNTTSTWTFDGTSWKKHPGVSPPAMLSYPLTAYDPLTRSVVVYGGWTKPGGNPQNSTQQIFGTWLWNGVTWREARSNAHVRVSTVYAAMAYDPMLGGVVLYDTKSHGTWLWTGTNWKRLITSNTASPGYWDFPSMVFDQSTGQLILVGDQPASMKATHFTTGTWVLSGTLHGHE